MNADAIRGLYDYHFAVNRTLWDRYIMPLEQEKFIKQFDYSVGSVRNHIVHLIDVDNSWFHDLQRLEPEPWHNPDDFADKDKIRTWWDSVETFMKAYLETLTDDMLPVYPVPENDPMTTWQILVHVVNHATDHRAQMLFMLNNMGVKTGPQDYFFYLHDDL